MDNSYNAQLAHYYPVLTAPCQVESPMRLPWPCDLILDTLVLLDTSQHENTI